MSAVFDRELFDGMEESCQPAFGSELQEGGDTDYLAPDATRTPDREDTNLLEMEILMAGPYAGEDFLS